MEKTIRASLIYIGRRIPWLADMLGLSERTIYRKLRQDDWSYRELKRMKELFRWETLEG